MPQEPWVNLYITHKIYSYIAHIPHFSPLVLGYDHLPCGEVGLLLAAAKREWRHINWVIAHSVAPGGRLSDTNRDQSECTVCWVLTQYYMK